MDNMILKIERLNKFEITVIVEKLEIASYFSSFYISIVTVLMEFSRCQRIMILEVAFSTG